MTNKQDQLQYMMFSQTFAPNKYLDNNHDHWWYWAPIIFHNLCLYADFVEMYPEFHHNTPRLHFHAMIHVKKRNVAKLRMICRKMNQEFGYNHLFIPDYYMGTREYVRKDLEKMEEYLGERLPLCSIEDSTRMFNDDDFDNIGRPVNIVKSYECHKCGIHHNDN